MKIPLLGLINSDNKKFVTDSMFTAVIAVVVNFVNYYINVIVAQEMPSKDFALFSTLIAILYLILVPVSTLTSAFTKTVAQNLDKDIGRFLVVNNKRYLKLSVGIVVIAGIALCIATFFDTSTSVNIAILTFGALVLLYSAIPRGVLMGMQYIKLSNVLLFVEVMIKIFLVVAILEISTRGNVALFAYILPVIAVSAISYFVAARNASTAGEIMGTGVRKPFDIDFKEIGVILATLLLFATAFTFDILMVDSGIRAEYAALALVGKIVYYGSIILVSVAFATAAKEKDPKKQRNLFGLTLLASFSISAVVMGLYAIFSDMIVEVMFEGKYTEISEYLVPFSFAMALYAGSFVLVNYFIVLEKKSHIVILILVPILQIVLFSINNDTLQAVVWNQVGLYGFMFVGLLGVAAIRGRS